MLYDWQDTDYKNLVNSFHNTQLNAVLISNGVNSGQNNLVAEFKNYILCSDRQGYFACGVCQSCILLRENNHPDVYFLNAEESDERKNNWIKVEQIRNVIEFVSRSNHISIYKIVIIPRAQDLNINSANALLKILEEPPKNCLFILQADNQSQLLPTIKSRCFKYQLSLPNLEQAKPLLTVHNNAEFWLNYFNGEPFFEVPFSDEQFECLINTLIKPSVGNIFILSKEVDPKKIGMDNITTFMLKWLQDLVLVKQNISVNYFNAQYQGLVQLSSRVNFENLFILCDDLIFLNEWSSHPLNHKLQFENILFKYQQLYV